MLIYLDKNLLKLQPITTNNQDKLRDALWIDLLMPTKEEETIVESYLGFEIPTRAEMVEIEQSSRLYHKNSNLFMTGTMVAQSDSSDPMLDPVTFILTKQQLITIRYIEPQSFKLFTSQIQQLETPENPTVILLDLLDVTIDRLADILELVAHRVDSYSKTIFRSPQNKAEKRDYQQLLEQIGADADLNTKAQESLVSFNRLSTFLAQNIGSKFDQDKQTKLTTISKDITSLSDHAHFLSTKVNFLLDATLGLVSIEQNNIIKIFSVAAVIFLPPTLVASIYGMNFHFMPELSWRYGYLSAIGLILFAAWLPYKYFKHRNWL